MADLIQQDVVRFDVPVDDASDVQELERQADLGADEAHLLLVERRGAAVQMEPAARDRLRLAATYSQGQVLSPYKFSR